MLRRANAQWRRILLRDGDNLRAKPEITKKTNRRKTKREAQINARRVVQSAFRLKRSALQLKTQMQQYAFSQQLPFSSYYHQPPPNMDVARTHPHPAHWSATPSESPPQVPSSSGDYYLAGHSSHPAMSFGHSVVCSPGCAESLMSYTAGCSYMRTANVVVEPPPYVSTSPSPREEFGPPAAPSEYCRWDTSGEKSPPMRTS